VNIRGVKEERGQQHEENGSSATLAMHCLIEIKPCTVLAMIMKKSVMIFKAFGTGSQ
jgi:hypothetical protein